MKEQKVNHECSAKRVYFPPRIEVYASEPNALLAGTFYGISAGQAEFSSYFTDETDGSGGGGSAGQADLTTGVSGAKTDIFGQEFSFTDVWAE